MAKKHNVKYIETSPGETILNSSTSLRPVMNRCRLLDCGDTYVDFLTQLTMTTNPPKQPGVRCTTSCSIQLGDFKNVSKELGGISKSFLPVVILFTFKFPIYQENVDYFGQTENKC